MNSRYLYQLKDQVQHNHFPIELGMGTIIQQGSSDEGEWVDELDPECPVYMIKWSNGEVGMEWEESLLPSYACPNASRMVQRLYSTNKPMWDELVKVVTQK